MRFKNIVFCSPSMITGGAEYYFIRHAQYIAEFHKEYKVYYVEYEDGFSHKVLNHPNVTFLNYKDGEKTVIPEDSIVCTPSSHIIKIEDWIRYNPINTIISISFAHFTHFSMFYTMNNYYKVSRKFRMEAGKEFEKMTDMGIIFFMGNLAYLKLSQQFLFPYHPIEPVPIPVPVDKYGIDFPLNRNLGETIRFCWLGRLCKEKALNILTYMNELEEINNSHKVSLSLIGLGPSEKMLRKYAKKYSYPIEFVGEKREDDLDTFIRNNVDVGLASGTSAYEFALRKVPVIQEWLIDKVYKANERDTYHFIEEFGNFTDITESSYRIVGQGTFEEKTIDLIDNYHNRCETAFLCAMKASPESCGEAFVSAMNKLQDIDMSEAYSHLRKAQKLTRNAHYNWMERIHLRRLYVPLCKLLGVRPAVM